MWIVLLSTNRAAVDKNKLYNTYYIIQEAWLIRFSEYGNLTESIVINTGEASDINNYFVPKLFDFKNIEMLKKVILKKA